jgi:hypothetical protein
MDADKREGRHSKKGVLRRTILILLVFVAVVLGCLTAASYAASLRLRVGYAGLLLDPQPPGGPLLCDVHAEHGWLHLDYTRTSKSESPGPMSTPRHWWGGWHWIQTDTGPNFRVLLPAWAIIFLLLAYPAYTLARLAIATPRRGSLTPSAVGGLRRGARTCHQPGPMRPTVMTIILLLFVLTLSLSIVSRFFFCPALSVSARDDSGARLKLALEEGWCKLEVTRGPAEVFFSVPIPTPYNWYGWSDAVQVGNATRYRAEIPSWEPIGIFAIYPSLALSGVILRHRRRRQRRARGLCLSCGYDLTGNVSGTCPECGRAVDTKSY